MRFYADPTNAREYALGTRVVSTPLPFATIAEGRALCDDGIVRAFRATSHPDTVFSVPAEVTIKGRHVSGFISFETVDGYTCETEDDPAIVTFRANAYGRNYRLLPRQDRKLYPSMSTDDRPTLAREIYNRTHATSDDDTGKG